MSILRPGKTVKSCRDKYLFDSLAESLCGTWKSLFIVTPRFCLQWPRAVHGTNSLYFPLFNMSSCLCDSYCHGVFTNAAANSNPYNKYLHTSHMNKPSCWVWRAVLRTEYWPDKVHQRSVLGCAGLVYCGRST